MKSLAIGTLLLLLAGCQATTFEQAPLAAAACDPELQGHWLSLPDAPKGREGEVQLHIDGDCRLQLREQKQDGTQTTTVTSLATAPHGAHRFVWTRADWDWLRFETGNPAQRQDVFILRYGIVDDRLVLQAIDSKAVAHLIIDGRLQGEVVKRQDSLLNRITGAPQPQALDLPGLFSPEQMRFRRSRDGERP